ncbi:hypothetical protein F511_17157 [Dorcoceras hygrometricum]|uniref:Uncharacterized protein n=1 Tax=Dorcoceras hygrometricum TaxID=472368 RepID=A0A2Z7CA43_9LAMI|nr:hypothetical protein F511_17157 [Dorcoceras hygrometricum]
MPRQARRTPVRKKRRPAYSSRPAAAHLVRHRRPAAVRRPRVKWRLASPVMLDQRRNNLRQGASSDAARMRGVAEVLGRLMRYACASCSATPSHHARPARMVVARACARGGLKRAPPQAAVAWPEFRFRFRLDSEKLRLTAESFSSVHNRITVLCSTVDSADVKVADPPVVSTADPDFLLLHLSRPSSGSGNRSGLVVMVVEAELIGVDLLENDISAAVVNLRGETLVDLRGETLNTGFLENKLESFRYVAQVFKMSVLQISFQDIQRSFRYLYAFRHVQLRISISDGYTVRRGRYTMFAQIWIYENLALTSKIYLLHTVKCDTMKICKSVYLYWLLLVTVEDKEYIYVKNSIEEALRLRPFSVIL